MKKIAIISSTPRKNGNSEILAEEFARGARESGNEVKRFDVRDIDLKFCRGCLACQNNSACVIDDGMNEICDEISGADVLVFATPVYYYSVSGQLKTFLDRLNPLFARENRFGDVYLLATAADDDASAVDGALTAVEGWISCFDGARLAGVVRGTGATYAGEIRNTDAPRRAYEAGKAV